jgi:hypothetical protein
MGWPYNETTYDLISGFNSQDNEADIAQPEKQSAKHPIRMVTAQNVYAPGQRFDLATAPGFAVVRATTVNAAGSFTGIHSMSELASDEAVMAVSIAAGAHALYRNNANPPTDLTGGTNFTTDPDNLVSFILGTDGTNNLMLAASIQRDTPQSIDASFTQADFSISDTTLPAFWEVLAGRALFGAPSVSGTVYKNRVYWSDQRDFNLMTSSATQFESFETKLGDRVRGLLTFSDVCMVGKRHNIFLLPPTPTGDTAFGTPQEVAIGMDKGPVGHHSMIAVEGQAFWLSHLGIHSLNITEGVTDWSDLQRPTFTGLNYGKLEFSVVGHDVQNNLIMFAVPASGSDPRNRVIALNYKTGAHYFWTRTRNAFGQLLVSGEPKLYGGGRVGLFYTENTGTTGNADDATAAIDADIITPRHHLNAVHQTKIFLGVKVVFDQQGSEAVTVQYRLNDASSWTSFADSPYSVAGTAGHIDMKYFPLAKAGRTIQFRFRDVNSGEAMRIQKYVIVWKLQSPGLTGLN